MPFILFLNNDEEGGGGSGNTYNEVGSGGILCNSSASVSKRINIIASGGALGSGSAPVLMDGDGGVYGSGSGTTFTIIASIIGSGGVNSNGTASVVQVSQTSGGVNSNGTAINRIVYNNRNVTGNQGIVSGNAAISSRYLLAGLGGAYANGSASFGINSNKSTSGGAYANGSATVYVFAAKSTSGGAYANGSAVRGTTVNVSGGMYANGTGSVQATIQPTMIGGASTGGQGIVQATQNGFTAGGLTGNGSAIYSVTVNSITKRFIITEDDMVLIDEDGDDNVYQDGADAILANGASQVAVSYRIAPSGGVKASGHGALIFNDQGHGGVMVFGEYFAHLYPNTGTGGAVLGGSAIPVLDHNYIQVDCKTIESVKCGYEEDDQFCAKLAKIQAYGSKFYNVQRRDPTYICAPNSTNTACLGSTAVVAAITLCEQRIRLLPEDQPPPRIISIAETDTPDLSMMAVEARPKNLLAAIRARKAGTPNSASPALDAL